MNATMAIKVGHLFADLRHTNNTSSNQFCYTSWRGRGLPLMQEIPKVL